MPEKMQVSGNRLLCKKPSVDREQKRGDLVIPQNTPQGRKMARQGTPQKPLEAIVVQRGSGMFNQSGDTLRSEEVQGIDPMFQPGVRVAISNAMVSPVYLDGEMYFIVDAEDVLGVIESPADRLDVRA